MEILNQEGHNVTAAPTTGPNTAGAMARAQIAGGADLIVVAGGDGTINEAINGLMMRERSPALGIIPIGTTNVLSRDLSLASHL